MRLAGTPERWLAAAGLVTLLALQAALFAQPIHSGASWDEGVYLAAVDALRHGQSLGSQVFAAQFPGFYDLLRGLSYVTGIGVVAIRWGMLAVTILGSVGPEHAGAASGIAQTVLWSGGSVGSALMVTVYGSASAGRHDAAATVDGLVAVFRTGAVFAVAGLLLSVLVLRVLR